MCNVSLRNCYFMDCSSGVLLYSALFDFSTQIQSVQVCCYLIVVSSNIGGGVRPVELLESCSQTERSEGRRERM